MIFRETVEISFLFLSENKLIFLDDVQNYCLNLICAMKLLFES